MEATIICQKCGASISIENNFCTSCGEPLPSQAKEEDKEKLHGVEQRSKDSKKTVESTKRVSSAGTVLWVLSIMFALFGTIFGYMNKSEADQAKRNLAQFAEDEMVVLETGENYIAGELLKQIDQEVYFVFGLNYFLAVIMLAAYFWSRSSPLPAIITGFAIYMSVQVLNAILDPMTIAQGIIIKIIFISVFIKGIKAAIEINALEKKKLENLEDKSLV